MAHCADRTLAHGRHVTGCRRTTPGAAPHTPEQTTKNDDEDYTMRCRISRQHHHHRSIDDDVAHAKPRQTVRDKFSEQFTLLSSDVSVETHSVNIMYRYTYVYRRHREFNINVSEGVFLFPYFSCDRSPTFLRSYGFSVRL